MRCLDEKMNGWLRKTILDPALWIGLVAALAIAFFGDEKGLRNVSVSVGSVQAQVGVALLGVVLAGLAILTVFLDEEFILLLEQFPPGLAADLWPFKYTATVAAICSVSGVSLILIGSPENTIVFRTTFFVALFSFLYLLWIMLDLISNVMQYAHTRGALIRGRKSSNAGDQKTSGRAPGAAPVDDGGARGIVEEF